MSWVPDQRRVAVAPTIADAYLIDPAELMPSTITPTLSKIIRPRARAPHEAPLEGFDRVLWARTHPEFVHHTAQLSLIWINHLQDLLAGDAQRLLKTTCVKPIADLGRLNRWWLLFLTTTRVDRIAVIVRSEQTVSSLYGAEHREPPTEAISDAVIRDIAARTDYIAICRAVDSKGRRLAGIEVPAGVISMGV